MSTNPFVSIIIPAWNEEKYLEKTLNSLLDQDYPKDKYEIIIINDFSTDGTLELANNYHKRFPKLIKVLSNPIPHKYKNSALARSYGIQNSNGEYFISFSAHASAPRNLIAVLTKKITSLNDDVVAVGCKEIPDPDSPLFSKAVGIALTSVFGGAGTSTHPPNRDGFVDQVAFAIFRKKIFEQIRNYPKGEDCELNIILNKDGYKKYFTRDTFVYYYWHGRSGTSGPNPLIALYKRMLNYGDARITHIKKYPSSLKMIYPMPSILMVNYILTIFLFFFNYHSLLFIITFSFSLLYLLATILFSIYESCINKSFKMMPFIILSYFIIHFSYGLGFILGLFRKNEIT